MFHEITTLKRIDPAHFKDLGGPLEARFLLAFSSCNLRRKRE